MKPFASLWICSLLALAQQVEAPVSGFVVDQTTQAVRPITGFAGAAVLGEPVKLGFAVRRAIYSSRVDAALVVSGDDGRLWIVQGLRRGPLAAAVVAGALADVDLWSWNEAGTAAVVVSRQAAQFQFVSGLPARAVAGATGSLASIPGEVRGVAIDSRGHQAILASAAPSCGGLYLLADAAEADLRWLASAGATVGMGWTRDDQDVVYADAATGEVAVLRDVLSAGEWTSIVSATDGLGELKGLQVQGNRAWVVSVAGEAAPSTGTLSELDLGAGRIAGSQRLPMTPVGLERLDGEGLFAFNQVDGAGALYLFTASDSAVWFVPQSVR